MKTKHLKFTKTSSWILLALMTLVISSCSKDDDQDIVDPEPNPPVVEIEPMTLDCDSFHSGNENGISLLEDRNDAVDYIITCVVNVDIDLKIAPGVVIAFEDGGGMKINESGSINAVGTTDKPISFTALTPTKGAWKGIMVSSTSVKNKFDYVVMQYAGDGGLTSNSEPASLILLADSYFRVSNTNIREGLDYGIAAQGFGYDVEITDVTISGCEIPLFVDTNIVSDISGGDFTGNQTNVIRLTGGTLGTIVSDQTWKKLSVPYRAATHIFVDNGAKWTLDPGVTIEFEDSKGIELDKMFDMGSAIIAVGTPEEPITFTGVTKAPGAWKTISIRRTSSVQNIFDNVIVEYGGGTDTGGAIEMWVNPVLTVTNSTIRNSKGCALYSKYEPENPNLTESNNTVENVEGGYICGQ